MKSKQSSSPPAVAQLRLVSSPNVSVPILRKILQPTVFLVAALLSACSNDGFEVDGYLRKTKKWREEFEKLRLVCLDCGLIEELKWGHPCYTFQKSNIVLIHGFKEYCALLFLKGALLKDAKAILVQQTENVQAARQIRFTNVREIIKMKPILKAYVKEAIQVEKAGLEVTYKRTSEFTIPEEFQNKLDETSQSPDPDPYQQAKLYARLGDAAKVFSLLEKAFKERHGGMRSLLEDDCWNHIPSIAAIAKNASRATITPNDMVESIFMAHPE